MATFSAYLEVGTDGWCTAWVGELLGFFLNVPAESEAMEHLPAGVKAYLRWLRRHGESIQLSRRVEIAVAERIESRRGMKWGSYSALHTCDRVPVTSTDVEKAIRWMGYMREDLLGLVDRLPTGAMSWMRTTSHEVTVKRYLQHIAGAERWYLQRFWPNLLRSKRAPTPAVQLARVRAMAVRRLRRMTARERSQVVKADYEYWSARKILGRFLYHERYHIRSIARIAIAHGLKVPKGLGGWHTYA